MRGKLNGWTTKIHPSNTSFKLSTILILNTHHPYKPVVEKRTISEVNSIPTGSPLKKHWEEKPPVADVDVHEKVKPQGFSKGTKDNKITGEPFKCQRHCTPIRSADSMWPRRMQFQHQLRYSSLQLFAFPISIRNKIISKYPTKESMRCPT